MNNVALFCSIIDTAEFDSVQSPRRRRMEREAKANVVASVWGAEFSQFLASSCFASVDLEEKVEFIPKQT